jgi:hypothetical protein
MDYYLGNIIEILVIFDVKLSCQTIYNHPLNYAYASAFAIMMILVVATNLFVRIMANKSNINR